MRKLLAMLALALPLLGAPSARAQEPEVVCLPASGERPGIDAGLATMSSPPRAELATHFTPGEIKRSADYRRAAYTINFTWLALDLLTIAVLGLVRARELGERAARRARGRPYRTALLLVAAMIVIPLVVTLPFRILDTINDHRAGLATNSAAAVVVDSLKSLGFSFIITAVGVVAFLLVARKLPRAWPAVAAAGAASLMFVLIYLLPVVYEPVFNRFTPVGPQTRARVLALAEREGVQINDVLVADASRRTSTFNAYVSGIGSTKRVVVYDTLLRGVDCDVFDLVIAHELAHEKHQDVLHGTYLSMAGAAAAVLLAWVLLSMASLRRHLGIEHAGDPKVVPFLVFFVAIASFLTLPIVNGISRYVEARADRTAIAVTDDPEAAFKTETQLAVRNLADLTPNAFVRFWFFSHPPALERIQFALDYEWERARAGR